MGTWLYVTLHHGSTSLYLILLLFTTTLLHSIWPYITLPWIYFSLLDSTSTLDLLHSTSLYLTVHHSTNSLLLSTLHYCTMALLHFTRHYCFLQLAHFTPHDSTLTTFPSLYFTLHYSTMVELHYTWLYVTTMALLHSTWYCITLSWLYPSLYVLDSTLFYHSSILYTTWLYITLLHSTWLYVKSVSTMPLLLSTWLYCLLPWLYFIVLDSASLYHGYIFLYITLPWFYFNLLDSTFYYLGCSSLCLTLLYFTMALVHCTWLYITLIDSTLIFYRSPSPLFDSYSIHMHGSTLLHLDFTWLYCFHGSTLVYMTLPSLYFTLRYSTLLYHGSTSLYTLL